MKKCLLFICCLSAAAIFLACSESGKKGGREPKQIPVLAWFSITAENTNLDRYLELKDAGFTHSFSHTGTADEVAMQLDTAQLAGIKLIITCRELESETEVAVNRFKNHPALDGYFLRDEPDRSAFAALSEWARKIESVDKKHYCYLNLLPTYASLEALKTASYREYVSLFIKEVNLPFVSYDHYPVIGDSSLRGDFYENLEIVADESRKAGKPFWAFALATAHDPYPIATMASLRLQVYSNLAYGAQGIQYFTYFTPVGTVWNFNHAPITETLQRSEVYDRVREMNKEIKALSFIFLGAEVRSVSHTGNNIPAGTKRLETLPEPFTSVSSDGKGVLVSELENNGVNYLVIVNRDLNGNQKITVECDDLVSRILKDGKVVPAKRYTSVLDVDAGDALIYMWKNN
ncbi:MAG: beta-galactosidase [Bacteroidaceae bacterium]|nr:beta-galactosidase [Bacteroidaceae bacterium]